MEVIKEALTFDDVLLTPRYSSVLPTETNLQTDLGYNLKLKIPFLSSAMDTVTESRMAIAIAQKGGLGIIHRNLSIVDQSKEIKKIKNKNFKKVDFFKPESSRRESKETYIICSLLKTL